MSKKKAPKPDKNIGNAAQATARTGQEYLAFMREQAKITNQWADEDRARSQTVFQPLEDRFIAEAEGYDSPERRAAAVSQAIGDVRQEAAAGRGMQERQLAAMGVNPASGRFAGETRRGSTAESLAAAGAANVARRQVEGTGRGLRADAINMGRGLSVNPGTSMGLSNSAASAGFQGAMSGYQAQGNMLLNQHSAEVNAWGQQQQMLGAVGQGLGMAFGAWTSSKDTKTAKRKPGMSVLEAVEGMPVEEWEYKKGMGDGGGRKHIGPYAEDFQKRTGLGDGRSINVIDAVGVTMGATKELAGKVRDLSRKLDRAMSVREAA
jgi:hypothetical protein